MNQKTMQPKREKQPTFFDLAVQQRGSVNRVLEIIASEVDFTAAEERVAATYSRGGRPACRVGVIRPHQTRPAARKFSAARTNWRGENGNGRSADPTHFRRGKIIPLRHVGISGAGIPRPAARCQAGRDWLAVHIGTSVTGAGGHYQLQERHLGDNLP